LAGRSLFRESLPGQWRTGPLLFSKLANRVYEEHCPPSSHSQRLRAFLSPHNHLRSLSCVPSFLIRYCPRNHCQLVGGHFSVYCDLVDAHPRPNITTVHRSRIHGPGLPGSTPPRKSVKVTRPAFRDGFAAGQSCHAVIVYIRLAAKQNAKSSRCLGPTSANTKIRRWKFSNKDEWPSHWPSPR
jgi:hypothetical protein